MRCFGSAVVVLLICSSSFAQEPQQPVFRSGVDLIEVDVSVVDERGRPIIDLQAGEFSVTVDGKLRKVESAEFVSMGPVDVRARREDEPRNEPDVAYSSNIEGGRGRLIVIAFDRDSVSFGRGRNATRAASQFLDWLGPADKVAFVTVPPTGAQVDFTANHRLIRSALERVVGVSERISMRRNIGIAEALAIVRYNDSFMEANMISRLCSQFQPGTIDWDVCDREVRTEATIIEAEMRLRATNSINTLRGILRMLRDIEGQKTVVWISEGLVFDEMGGELSDIEQLAGAALVTLNVLQLDSASISASQAQLSPSATEDRRMEEQGLETLANMTRGTLYRVTAGAEFAFELMATEMSGYYLLGVESRPEDGDGKRRGLKVSVLRPDATVRARRAFVMATKAPEPATLDQQLFRALRSPVAVTEMPLRVATYAFQDAGDSKVRVLLATEIGSATRESSDIRVAYVIIGPDGNVVTEGAQRVTLSPEDGPAGPVLEYASSFAVEPGNYTLKLAVVDPGGRRGSIEHPVQAWQMTGVPLAVSDLVLDDAPTTPGERLRPHVEPRLTGAHMAAHLEVYVDVPDSFDGMDVEVQVARERTGEALVSTPARLSPTEDPTHRIVSALIPVRTLPPGRYVARTLITRGDEKIGELARHFYVTSASAAASVEALIPAMLVPTRFEHNDVLRSEVIGSVLDVIDRGRPEVRAATSQVREGVFAGAARAAFETGDQLTAMFLRGLELFANADLDGAATQFTGALEMAPDFTPAAVYLGACYAAGGRDADAVQSWRRAIAVGEKLPVAYSLLGDALQRQGAANEAVAVLREGVETWSENDELRRGLAIAYVTGLQHADALATIEPYIVKYPSDHEAVLVALQAIYAAHVAGEPLLTGADEQEQLAKYAQAYLSANGPHEELVKLWVASLRSPPSP